MAVDNSAWDGNRAMGECDDAADYRAICAGEHGAGTPDERQHWALPHHYLASQGKAKPPNAGGVRAALARVGQTQDLTNREAARSHLEAHMSTIQSAEGNSLVHREDGRLEVRMPIDGWEVRHSGRADESFTVRGYAAVYNQLSLDLGGFREMIQPGAFDAILASNPDVHFVWDHDTRYVGARTANGTLELRSDNTGLYMDARVGNYSWAKDLRTALERRDIDQGSFAFTVGDDGDDWEIQDDESILRTIRTVSGLYDVTVTAQGAYPQTSMAAAMRSLDKAVSEGRLPAERMAAGATLVASDKGEPESPAEDRGSAEAGTNPEAEALRHRIAVERDRISALQERLNKL